MESNRGHALAVEIDRFQTTAVHQLGVGRKGGMSKAVDASTGGGRKKPVVVVHGASSRSWEDTIACRLLLCGWQLSPA